MGADAVLPFGRAATGQGKFGDVELDGKETKEGWLELELAVQEAEVDQLVASLPPASSEEDQLDDLSTPSNIK